MTSFPPQILQRLVLLASESLRALEEQLMDPLSDHDVKVTNPLGQQHKRFQALTGRLGFGVGFWDVLGGFRLWPCGCPGM